MSEGNVNFITPKGLRQLAQGCEERATLGNNATESFPLSSRGGRRGPGRGGFPWARFMGRASVHHIPHGLVSPKTSETASFLRGGLLLKNKNAKRRTIMHTFLFLNRRMRARLIGSSLLMLACGFLSETFAQTVSQGTNGDSILKGEQQKRLALLAVSGLLPAKTDAGATTSGLTNQTPTYLRDVLPIFMGKCSRC